RDSKLTMLLRESLGNMNCRTTMIAHISASPRDFSETLFTIQIASRVLRMKKKKTKQYTSSSSGGESSCEEGRMRRPTHLRPFHHRGDTDSDLPLLRLSSDHDEYSSSEQSCDTVIYVGPNGAAVSDRELTDNEGPPEFVPIIPALLRGKAPEQQQQQSQPAGAQIKEGAECLKCNTFAELQERLDCIDGSEEVAKFPFEEIPARKQGAKQEPCCSSATAGLVSASGSAAAATSRRTNDQQLQELKDVVEEAELAQTMIHSLAQTSGCTIVTNTRSVTGSSSITSNPLHKARGSHLNDSRESLCVDAKTRPLGSPRLGIASLTKASDFRPPCSPSQRCKVHTQKGVMPATPPLYSLAADSGRSSTESLLSRSSPVGMSLQVQEPAPSLSASLGSAETLCDDDVPPIPLDTYKDGEAQSDTACLVHRNLEASGAALSVGIVGPLSLGEDELAHPKGPGGVKNCDATAPVEIQGPISHPKSIISFKGDQRCATVHPSGLPTTTAGVTEVVAMAEVAMAKLRMDAMSNYRSPASSWMSDLSMGSDADQSLHSFSQSRSQQGEALADPGADINLCCGGSVEGDAPLSESGGDRAAPTKDRLRKLPPSMAKTNIQLLGASGSFSPFKNTISVHPCVAVRPMVIQEPTIASSPTKTSLVNELGKTNPPLLASISSEMSFEDPWLKRGLEEGRSKEPVCELKLEQKEAELAKRLIGTGDRQSVLRDAPGGDQGSSGSGGDTASSPDSFKRVVDGCEMVAVVAPGESIYNPDIHRTGSLPRAWHRLNRHDGLDNGAEYRNLGVTTSTPCSPRATLDRRGSTGRQGFFSHKKGGIPPLPPVRKSSLDQRNRAASPLHQSAHGVLLLGSSADDAGMSGYGSPALSRQRGSSIDSSRLFSAKLEQLANRTNSLGRNGSHHYDCFSLERDGSLRVGGARGESTMPRIGRSLTRNGSVSSPSGNPGNPSLSGSNSAPQSPAKTSSQSKMSAVSKLLLTSSPKARSLSTSSTKTLSFSTKSLSQASSRSSSLPPNGKVGSWSTQSLSRSRGGSLAAKLPLRAVNGRISELLQGSTGSRSRSHSQGGSPDPAEERSTTAQTLPSPYSKITAPRKPHRCSSGHASDNSSSVLSGELPPAMGKTALFYHSGGSSGYESMLRDSSENTGSTSSAQDSLSEHSSVTTSSRRSSKSSKKNRNNAGLQRRRLIPGPTLDTITSSSSSSSSPGACWVDGPLGPPAPSNLRGAAATAETFEIKVYEIDDVERLHKRRDKAGNKEGVHVSARLRLMEHRQQRISEVRARYQSLRTELEQTKQHLMLEPHKWIAEFELQQAYEVDSLEYLEALETMTDRLETRVNFCKAHLMMITCFDVSSKHR
uniref:Kinesin family member 26B n=1 Tax=Tetraodon nigroviridis TaxID=99883 RepID=H3DK07_TETNG